jgi:hypothetical protein
VGQCCLDGLCFLHWVLRLVRRWCPLVPGTDVFSLAGVNLDPKKRKVKRRKTTSIYHFLVELLAKPLFILWRWGTLETCLKDGSRTNYCLANQSQTRKEAHVKYGNDFV